jgi:hypothetical protein
MLGEQRRSCHQLSSISNLALAGAFYLSAARFRSKEVAMNNSLLAVIIVIALVVGTAVSLVKKACKSGDHVWCAPMSTVHHTKTRLPV